jgi:hypothetical protein
MCGIILLPCPEVAQGGPIDWNEQIIHIGQGGAYHCSVLATLLNHPEQTTLPFQQQAIKMFHAAERQTAPEEDTANPISSPTASSSHGNSPIVQSETNTTVPLVSSGPKRRRAYVSDEEKESNDECEDACTNSKPPSALPSLEVT